MSQGMRRAGISCSRRIARSGLRCGSRRSSCRSRVKMRLTVEMLIWPNCASTCSDTVSSPCWINNCAVGTSPGVSRSAQM